jgi:oxygen-independent coproporphyrinogen-3 oxidase
LPEAITQEPLALYVHWPFCLSKCPYCDFNSHVRAKMPEEEWLGALLADMEFEAASTGGRPLVSIFFGGGTPSLMQPSTVRQIIERAMILWRATEDIEITLEANPNSVEAARFAGFADAGVNRVSLGLQALDDRDLKALGRQHSVAEGLAALDIAQRHFTRVSFDLIYAREGQAEAAWQAELARALAFGTGHISLYQLTIEPGTNFAARHKRGELVLPAEDPAADMFALTQQMTEEAGLPAYETSNHARPGQESRHNLIYWNYGDYIGVGPGAHGRIGGTATMRERLPERWLRGMAETHQTGRQATPLSPAERSVEALMMGLRLSAGIDRETFGRRTGRSLDETIDNARAGWLVDQGLLRMDASGIALTPAARPLLDAILPELLVGAPS